MIGCQPNGVMVSRATTVLAATGIFTMIRTILAAAALPVSVALLTATASAQTHEVPLRIDYNAAVVAWSGCPAVFPQGCELTILHGDPGQPGADVMLRVAPGQTLPDHSHSSAERMMLAAGRLSVKYRGYPETTLSPGNYAYGPANLPHRATCVSDEPCVLFIAFDGPVDAVPVEGGVD